MHLPRFRHRGDERPVLACNYCGGEHPGLCRYQLDRASNAPVEHPFYGGLYTGPAPVRVIPPGISGEDEYGRPKRVTDWLRRAGRAGGASKRRGRG